ncbi:MAG: hypothetical protein HRT58_14285 [Crocinitomicaceae bacterium]|nr:hypothetical protein [Flavobacteriales bacterium]NQZ36834.1 hypothetical protein [Crocinitomicaceae bacterium]
MKKSFYLIIALFVAQFSFSQDDYVSHIDRSFLIIASSIDFEAAQKTALKAKNKLGLDYPTSIYYPDESEGFKTDEVCGCGEVHGYFPRGGYDGGNYVSIEYSSGYDGFAEGYYIVIVSSGQKAAVQKELSKVKKHFAQAYIKNSEIYVGCRH